MLGHQEEGGSKRQGDQKPFDPEGDQKPFDPAGADGQRPPDSCKPFLCLGREGGFNQGLKLRVHS